MSGGHSAPPDMRSSKPSSRSPSPGKASPESVAVSNAPSKSLGTIEQHAVVAALQLARQAARTAAKGRLGREFLCQADEQALLLAIGPR